ERLAGAKPVTKFPRLRLVPGILERLHRGFERVDLVDDLADRADITDAGRAEQALGKASKHGFFLGMRMKWRRFEPRKLSETGPYAGWRPEKARGSGALFERAVATGQQAGKIRRSRLARLAAAARLAPRRCVRRRAALAIARFGLARRFG